MRLTQGTRVVFQLAYQSVQLYSKRYRERYKFLFCFIVIDDFKQFRFLPEDNNSLWANIAQALISLQANVSSKSAALTLSFNMPENDQITTSCAVKDHPRAFAPSCTE